VAASDPERVPFQYALVRVVPHVERGECLNAGVVVFCRARGFLAARTELDEHALAALAADCDPAEVRAPLAVVEAVAAGDVAAGGAVAALAQSERFHWLTAPASTVVQPSAVHTGLTADPARELQHLFQALVARSNRQVEG
jgi:hypothetical protein